MNQEARVKYEDSREMDRKVKGTVEVGHCTGKQARVKGKKFYYRHLVGGLSEISKEDLQVNGRTIP